MVFFSKNISLFGSAVKSAKAEKNIYEGKVLLGETTAAGELR